MRHDFGFVSLPGGGLRILQFDAEDREQVIASYAEGTGRVIDGHLVFNGSPDGEKWFVGYDGSVFGPLYAPACKLKYWNGSVRFEAADRILFTSGHNRFVEMKDGKMTSLAPDDPLLKGSSAGNGKRAFDSRPPPLLDGGPSFCYTVAGFKPGGKREHRYRLLARSLHVL